MHANNGSGIKNLTYIILINLIRYCIALYKTTWNCSAGYNKTAF